MPQPKTSWVSIVSLVLALLGAILFFMILTIYLILAIILWILAIIFGFLALSQIKKLGFKGKTLAWIGIIISTLGILFLFFILLFPGQIGLGF